MNHKMIIKKMKKLIKNQRGATLIFVLMTFFVLLILGTGLLTVNSADNTESNRQDDNLQAYYLAKSGAMAMGTGIINKSKMMSEGDFQTYLNSIINITSESTYIGSSGGYFNVKVVNDAAKGLGVISTGTMGNISKTVTVWLISAQSSATSIDYALFANSKIEMTGSVSINGDTHTNIDIPIVSKKKDNIICTGTSLFNGNFYASGSSAQDWSVVTDNLSTGSKLYTDQTKLTFSMPQFPAFPTFTNKGDFSTNGWQEFHMDANYYYPNITVKGSATLFIDTNNKDCSIVCDNLDVSGSNGIRVNGTGTVTIYIKNKFSMNGSVTVGSSTNNINIYYAGTQSYTMGGGTTQYGSFYANTADVNVGGSAKITGSVLSGGTSVDISGAIVAQLIYAPKAAVTISGSSEVRGAVVAETLSLTGASKITYDPSAVNYFNTLFSSSQKSYALGAWE